MLWLQERGRETHVLFIVLERTSPLLRRLLEYVSFYVGSNLL